MSSLEALGEGTAAWAQMRAENGSRHARDLQEGNMIDSFSSNVVRDKRLQF